MRTLSIIGEILKRLALIIVVKFVRAIYPIMSPGMKARVIFWAAKTYAKFS